VAPDRVIYKLFNKTMQKISGKLSKGGPHGISERGSRGDRLFRLPYYPPLINVWNFFSPASHYFVKFAISN